MVFADSKVKSGGHVVPVKSLPENMSNIKNTRMPDLKNYSLRDGIKILTKLGLKYKVSGTGLIIGQSIKPGDKIKKGLLCNIDCKEVQISGASVY